MQPRPQGVMYQREARAAGPSLTELTAYLISKPENTQNTPPGRVEFSHAPQTPHVFEPTYPRRRRLKETMPRGWQGGGRTSEW